jgi:tRNA (adenine57-N1/adenine58-N1)-methyltransferase
MKVLINKKTQNRHLWKGIDDLHTKEGILSKVDLDTGNSVVLNNNGKEYTVFDAQKIDLVAKIKRGPQIITPKDLGYIISRTYVGKNSKIVEAGGGSGAATLFFANIAKLVHTYEIREEHTEIIQKNLDMFEVDNVKLSTGDLTEHIESEEDIDLLFLDMPEPVSVLEKNIKGLGSGKFICCYLPSISQIQELTMFVKDNPSYYVEEISEVQIREWKVWDRISRPLHRKENDFTAFLVFLRKL